MKIVIAPDSFKESLTALEVAESIARGIHRVLPEAQTVCIPMADGGEGTLVTVLDATASEPRHARVSDALGRPIDAQWGWLSNQTALIEMASAAGLEHIAVEYRDPLIADTFGVGELIRAALDAGARTIVLTAGGSATNDGGAGMLRALGMRWLDDQGNPLAPGGAALAQLDRADASDLDPRLAQIELIIATDVNNPLCGPSGASATFGPQKGATPELVQQLDRALARLADVTAHTLAKDVRDAAGAGAAGGLGFAAMAWLNAQMKPGVQMIAELVELEASIQQADLVFTGEGRMDAQTQQGKTPMGVIQIAQRHQVPVIALAGQLGDGYQSLYEMGLTAAFSLANGPLSLKQAVEQGSDLLESQAADIMRTWQKAAAVGTTRRSTE